MVLALSLDRSFPGRELIVTMTFGVVLISILVQGLSMSRLLRWLGLVERRDQRDAYEMASGRLQAATAALEELERMARSRRAPRSLLAYLRERYEKRVESLEGDVEQLRERGEGAFEDELCQVQHHLVLVEKARTLELHRDGALGREPYEKLLADLDARLQRLESGQPEPGEESAEPGGGPEEAATR
jgi:CPA1 family monovalent cation:H+ antiporter